MSLGCQAAAPDIAPSHFAHETPSLILNRLFVGTVGGRVVVSQLIGCRARVQVQQSTTPAAHQVELAGQAKGQISKAEVGLGIIRPTKNADHRMH